MSVDLKIFVDAFQSGFGKSSLDEETIINEFNEGVDVSKKHGSDATQIVDAYCFLRNYLSTKLEQDSKKHRGPYSRGAPNPMVRR